MCRHWKRGRVRGAVAREIERFVGSVEIGLEERHVVRPSVTERIEVTDDVGRDLSADSDSGAAQRCRIDAESAAREVGREELDQPERRQRTHGAVGAEAEPGETCTVDADDVLRGHELLPLQGDRVVLHLDALEALQREKRQVCQIQPPCDRNPSAPHTTVRADSGNVRGLQNPLRQHGNVSRQNDVERCMLETRIVFQDLLDQAQGADHVVDRVSEAARDDRCSSSFRMTAGIDDRAVLSS